MNKLVCIGRLGKDPELKYLPNQTAILSFSVATSRKVGQEERTTWIDCSLFGKRAEKLNFLRRGMQVYVDGFFEARNWQDKNGNKRQNWSLSVDALEVLTSPRESGDHAPRQTSVADAAPAAMMTEDDIPF